MGNTDIDSLYTKNGSWIVRQSNLSANKPSGQSNGIITVVCNGWDGVCIQYWDGLSENACFIRRRQGGTWNTWMRCDNFGCSTPEALASLMGGMNNSETKAYGQNEFDANTLVCGCVRGLNFKNTPAIDGYLVSLGTTKTGVTLLRIQIFYDGQAGKIYMRAGYPEMYTEWKEV